jgi:hypothetical protein
MGLKERRCSITMNVAELWTAVAELQIMHFRKCFELWHDHWADCVKSQADCFEGTALIGS